MPTPEKLPAALTAVVLLVLSNGFMTFAWYYHLQRKQAWSLAVAILISWLIALPEYILQVPANRIGAGAGGLTLSQLKIMQEAITLAVFTGFAVLVARQSPTARDGAAMLLVLAAVAVSFSGRPSPAPPPAEAAGASR